MEEPKNKIEEETFLSPEERFTITMALFGFTTEGVMTDRELVKDVLTPTAHGNPLVVVQHILRDNIRGLVVLGEILADKEKNLPGNNPNSPG